MKYLEEFRDKNLAAKLAARIIDEADPVRTYRFMEFCGGHTHAIARYGIESLLPENVQMIHGPGCPVCVLPVGRIDNAIELARMSDVILCTYADMMRVPATKRASLIKAKAEGADVRMVYSTLDVINIARDNPDREVIFFAIGFEATTPPTALAVRQAMDLDLKNFTVFCNHVLTPAAITAILDDGIPLDGLVGPAHVSAVIGTRPYEPFALDFGQPIVIAGFEPLDVMQAILMLIGQVNDGRSEIENEYRRAVTVEGNLKAQVLMAELFELRETFEWRGLGEIPDSALRLKPEFAHLDAEKRFGISYIPVPDTRGCECGAILRGHKHPMDCRLFGTACTPENPMGACMVSSEGACAAHWTYGWFRENGKRT